MWACGPPMTPQRFGPTLAGAPFSNVWQDAQALETFSPAAGSALASRGAIGGTSVGSAAAVAAGAMALVSTWYAFSSRCLGSTSTSAMKPVIIAMRPPSRMAPDTLLNSMLDMPRVPNSLVITARWRPNRLLSRAAACCFVNRNIGSCVAGVSRFRRLTLRTKCRTHTYNLNVADGHHANEPHNSHTRT